MISTLFQNTLSPSFHAIVKAAIQISLCQYEWPLLKLFYANIFPTGKCPLALLLIYPKYSAHTFCLSFFYLLKFQMTRAQLSPFPLVLSNVSVASNRATDILSHIFPTPPAWLLRSTNDSTSFFLPSPVHTPSQAPTPPHPWLAPLVPVSSLGEGGGRN